MPLCVELLGLLVIVGGLMGLCVAYLRIANTLRDHGDVCDVCGRNTEDEAHFDIRGLSVYVYCPRCWERRLGHTR